MRVRTNSRDQAACRRPYQRALAWVELKLNEMAREAASKTSDGAVQLTRNEAGARASGIPGIAAWFRIPASVY